MGSRSERVAALRDFASHLSRTLDEVQAGLVRLRIEIMHAQLDAEERAVYQHEFESAVAQLEQTIVGVRDTQVKRLLQLAEGLESMEHASSSAQSAPARAQTTTPSGSSAQPDGWKDGVLPADPDRREFRPRLMKPGRG